jgi:hypothetical protein
MGFGFHTGKHGKVYHDSRGGSPINIPMSDQYASDNAEHKKHLLKRAVGFAHKSKEQHENEQFQKQQEKEKQDKHRNGQLRAIDENKEMYQSFLLQQKQLESGELDYRDLNKQDNIKNGKLPAEFKAKQDEARKDQLDKMSAKNKKEQDELSGHIDDNRNNVLAIQRKIEEAQRELGKIDLSPPKSDDPQMFMKHQNDLAEAKNRELKLKKEIETLQAEQTKLNQETKDVTLRLNDVKKDAQNLNFVGSTDAFGMAKGDPHEKVMDKGRIDAAAKERVRHDQEIHNPTSIEPSGTQHQRYDRRTHQYNNTMPTVFAGFDENGEPQYELKKPKPTPDMNIKDDVLEQVTPEELNTNKRIDIRLMR